MTHAKHITTTDDRKVLAYGRIRDGKTTIVTPDDPDDPYRRIMRLVAQYGIECAKSTRAWADMKATDEQLRAQDIAVDEAYSCVCKALLAALEDS